MPQQRPLAHEVDAMAMRHIPVVLPPAWVVRHVQNDYGIDLEIEPFAHGRSLGSVLFVQVKGVSSELSWEDPWSFSMKTTGLTYAEMFAVPVLLFVRPVRSDRDGFRFLWLQEYIEMDLSMRNPGWRDQKSATLHLPVANEFIGHGVSAKALERLVYIAERPRRSRDLGVLTHLANEYRYTEARYDSGGDREDLALMDSILDRSLALESLFGNNGWGWSRFLATQSLRPPHALIKKVLRGETVGLEDFPNYQFSISEDQVDEEMMSFFVASAFRAVGETLLAIAAGGSNSDLKRAVYQATGDHDF